MTRGPATLVLALGLALAVSSCGGDSGPTQDLPPYVQAELDGANDFVRGILADGEVTLAEYETAIRATLSCLSDAGVPHSEPSLRSGGLEPSRFEYTYGPVPLEDDARVDAIYRDCWEAYARRVETVWVQQEALTEEELQVAQAEIVQCMRERGLDFPDYGTFVATQPTLPDDQQDIAVRCAALIFQGHAFPR